MYINVVLELNHGFSMNIPPVIMFYKPCSAAWCRFLVPLISIRKRPSKYSWRLSYGALEFQKILQKDFSNNKFLALESMRSFVRILNSLPGTLNSNFLMVVSVG